LGGISDFFSSLSIIYVIGAGFTLFNLVRYWREFWAGGLTPRAYQLSGGVAFFLLVPLGVLLHEFGHMLAVWSTGGRVLELGYFLYWGYVSYLPATADPLAEWYVSLAGNFLTFLLGVVCITAAVRLRTVRPVIRLVLLQLGILEITQALIFYPLLDLDPNFAGDWESIYSFQAPVASAITAAVHAISLVAFVVFLRRSETAKRFLPFA
jgi:hypothetical protein